MTYTLISYRAPGEPARHYYVEGDVESHQLSPLCSILEDGVELPEEASSWCLLDLPEGALYNELSPEERDGLIKGAR